MGQWSLLNSPPHPSNSSHRPRQEKTWKGVGIPSWEASGHVQEGVYFFLLEYIFFVAINIILTKSFYGILICAFVMFRVEQTWTSILMASKYHAALSTRDWEEEELHWGVLDKQVIPCKSVSSLAAFDELFKAHFVFGTSYSQMLSCLHVIVQCPFLYALHFLKINVFYNAWM